ncbi:MAG: prolyl oligopeptidase family serine peptidase [Actinomycetaceae bacterium]|nr:prolyl oligopeptidase family serine peptidase [Actinomycetaceae bacterium]
MSSSNQHTVYDEVDSPEVLKWVRNHNERALDRLGTAREAELEAQILPALDSPDKIPFVTKRGEWAYNFWTDADNPRGLWRRQKLDTYLAGADQWETLIDVDQLSAEEGKSWVWKGASVVFPQLDRALVSLSDGGSDTAEVREFDIDSRSFVEDGFYCPPAKSSVGWIDRDHVWVATDFGPDTLTDSGYPRQVRKWTRGQNLNEAELVFTGEKTDVAVGAMHDRTPGWERDWILQMVDFYHSETYVIEPASDQGLRHVPCPSHTEAVGWRDWLLFRPREDWEFDGQVFPAGSLLASPMDEFLAGVGRLHALFTPKANVSLEDITLTRNHVVVTVLHDVVTRLGVLTPPRAENSGWDRRDLDLSGTPADGKNASKQGKGGHLATLSVAAVDPYHDDQLWVTSSSFISPTTLSLLKLSQTGSTKEAQQVRHAPQLYDTSKLEVTQHFATSDDGTRIPYFQVSTAKQDGPAPTILYGYGGFEVSLTPAYLPVTGRAWLERGGTYVMANIRGGGEYGPAWHQAALKENRHRAYEDFAAVARDLVARGVTTVESLGAMGGSNGGLVMGMMLTKYPQLFGAIVCQVPLLDMRRYHTLHAGASWMAEYGDPDDPQQWEFIRTYSPYHLWREDGNYPPVFFTTSTRDDRVHPAHARSMVAQMDAAGQDVTFYENIEGGHAGAADNAQRAKMSALAYEFFWQHLAK